MTALRQLSGQAPSLRKATLDRMTAACEECANEICCALDFVKVFSLSTLCSCEASEKT